MLYLPVCSGSRTGGRGWSSRPRVTLSLSLAGRTLVVYYGHIPGLSSSLGGCWRAEPLGGGAPRRRVAVVAVAKTSKARSPPLSHPWHACLTEERRRHADVLAFSALELLGFEARAAAKPRRHIPNSAEGASIWLKARRWRRGFARTLRRASCCLCRLKTINRAGRRARVSEGPRQRQDDWKGLRDGRKRW